jgi:hypothetical protein
VTTHICEHAGATEHCGRCPHSQPHESAGQYDGLTCDNPGECYRTGAVTRCVPVGEAPETRTIEVPVFRSPDGRPTCAARYGVRDKECRFLRARKYGTDPVCAVKLCRVDDEGDGYLRPCDGCPLWS